MQHVVSLAENNLSLSFSAENGGVKEIKQGEISFRFSGSKLWQLVTRDAGGSEHLVDNTSASRFSHTISGSKATLSWHLDGDMSGIEVTATININAGLSYWDIDVRNNTGLTLFEVDYPYIGGIGKISQNHEDDYLALPWQWGVLVKEPIDFIAGNGEEAPYWDGKERGPYNLAYEYPGMYAMQFLAYGTPGSGGLYLGAHDGDANYKRFGFYGCKDCAEVDYILKNSPEGMITPGQGYRMPYSAVIGLFEDEWWNAAAIYKEWAVRQKWCAAGKTGSRTDIPDWIKDVGLWYWNWNFWKRTDRPDRMLPALKDLKERMQVPMAFHWYAWEGKRGDEQTYPYHSLTPEIRDRLFSAIKELKSEGIKAIPYMNGRLWDSSEPHWQKYGAAPYAARLEKPDADGLDFYTDPYYGKPVAVMCPHTEFWQDKVTEIVSGIVDYGFDGCYIDQIASGFSVICFNKDHGHNPGGDYWNRGFHSLMEKLRTQCRAKHPDAAFTSESVVECFIDVFDAFLGYQCMCYGLENMFGEKSLTAPLFSSVYHEFIPLYVTGTKIEDEAAFYFGLAWESAGGVVPSIQGYFADDIGRPDYDERLAYVESWARKYDKVKSKLLDAIWMPLPDIHTDSISVELREGVAKDVPAVVASMWQAGEDEFVLVAVNHTDSVRRASLSFDGKSQGPHTITPVDGSEELSFNKANGTIYFNAEFAPRSVNVYVISEK